MELDQHTLQKGNAVEKEAMELNPEGQRKRGRPQRSWQRTIQEEALAVGKTWGKIKQLIKNCQMATLCQCPMLQWELKDDDDDGDNKKAMILPSKNINICIQ
jgi:hypothetical protein